MVFTTTSTWDNGSGCAYYSKEKFIAELSAMIDGCVANGGTYFDVEVTTDASTHLNDETEEDD